MMINYLVVIPSTKSMYIFKSVGFQVIDLNVSIIQTKDSSQRITGSIIHDNYIQFSDLVLQTFRKLLHVFRGFQCFEFQLQLKIYSQANCNRLENHCRTQMFSLYTIVDRSPYAKYKQRLVEKTSLQKTKKREILLENQSKKEATSSFHLNNYRKRTFDIIST